MMRIVTLRYPDRWEAWLFGAEEYVATGATRALAIVQLIEQ